MKSLQNIPVKQYDKVYKDSDRDYWMTAAGS